MNTKNLLIILTFFFFTSCGNKNETGLEDNTLYERLIRNKQKIMNMERPKDSYNYPVYPCMEEWKNLSTEQKNEICQVPSDKLEKMSTQAVIQAVWEHPLLFEVFHRYQYQMDFETMFLNNNAYNELCKRSDAGASLLERLKKVNPLYPVSETGFEFEILELLMAQNIFISQLDNNEKKTAIEYASNKDDLRKQDSYYTDKPERLIAWLLAGRIMFNAGYAPFISEINQNDELKSFITLRTYVYLLHEKNENIQQIIIQHADYFKQISN
ncbi:MAG: hypothetical protein LBH32_02500 [Dysgonamonadaceae bacterium]|jgi:hypothetical protein|nr:hypothetical protein [Dysgonamonadaceae bacterium]